MPGTKAYNRDLFNLAFANLTAKYATERLLQKEKLIDLEYLTENFITPAHNLVWWEELVRRQRELQGAGDVQVSDEEDKPDDPDNINLDYDDEGAPAPVP